MKRTTIRAYLLLLLLPSFASGAAIAEEDLTVTGTLHSVWVQIGERKVLEPSESDSSWGYRKTANVKTLHRYQWRIHRVSAQLEFPDSNHPSGVSKQVRETIKDRLRECLKSPDMETAIAPRQDQVDLFERELSQCLQPSIPANLELKSLEHKIDTRETGWVSSLSAVDTFPGVDAPPD